MQQQETASLTDSEAENDESSRAEEGTAQGSNVAGAIFNFTNAIVGAGAIGLGGAIAASGGFVSIALIIFFGLLTKLSLDLVIRLSLGIEDQSYEGLAAEGLGRTGRVTVLICKLFYAFGCLVAYIVVIRDNLAPALGHLIFGSKSTSKAWFHHILDEPSSFTWMISLTMILPLCLLRDMTPLASFSVVSLVSMVSIVAIVMYIYFGCPDIGEPSTSFSKDWLEIRPGIIESLGTFVFTFVSQHTVHLVFGSLKPNLQTLDNFKKVSSWSLFTATSISVTVGLFVYMTFWDKTESDIFDIYPQSWMIDVAKILLCTTMVLTFPLPLFTCRELLIVVLVHPCIREDNSSSSAIDTDPQSELLEPLLDSNEDVEGGNEIQEENGDDQNGAPATSSEPSILNHLKSIATPRNWLLPEDSRQLRLVGHVFLTTSLWFVCTGLAIAAPNLGDVLDLVGCFSGTIIAFILPGLLAMRLEGYSCLALLLLIVGASVGVIGTYFSVQKLYVDLL
ncbi:unnamed protein product [Cylindrotheca closterium]|uniref:Amino acid transporter transmembrane domain-containing protein n=1 Tax=Cylindrotheca closterium TaxID=2856 RepID=A0AAD2PY01_9STRA|nr:unnamed protein product [Cylindrotheca closterium]